MHAVMKKWGNSLALRIPKPAAKAAGLKDGTEVEVIQDGTRLVIKRSAHSKYTLAQMLKGYPTENRPTETNTGAPVGNERIE
jgi:antitoxin MazE